MNSDAPGMLTPTLEEIQHWTGVIGRAQQLMLEYAAQQAATAPAAAPALPDLSGLWAAPRSMTFDTDQLARAQSDFWKESLSLWQRFLDPAAAPMRSVPRIAASPPPNGAPCRCST